MSWEKFKTSVWYQKWIWKRHVSKSFHSVDAMMRDLDSRGGVLQEIYDEVRYALKHWFWEFPRDIRLQWETETQRARKGWAISDTWNFDWYLARTISDGLTHIKKVKHGVPSKCFEGLPEKFPGCHTEEASVIAEQRWDNILDTVIYTFKVRLKAMDHELYIPQDNSYFTDEELLRQQDFCTEWNKEHPNDTHRIITRDEFELYLQGWKYFKEYFGCFWD